MQDNPNMEALYRAAVGPKNADYYVSRFQRFDEAGASLLSWNWPAFFVAFYWGLYRRMYANSLIFCLLVPIGVVLGLAVVLAALRHPLPTPAWLLLIVAYSRGLVPLFANALYHRFILRRINRVRAKVADPAVQRVMLENGPHTNRYLWLVLLVLFVPVTGILAAIAIPAYQNYTVRTQIAQGLRLSRPLEDAIARDYVATGHWPADLSALRDVPHTSGSFVSAIAVNDGTISIRYGNQANRLIADQVLSLRPTLRDHAIVWSCGYGTAGGNDPATGAAGPDGTTVDKRFLPMMCRS